MAKRIAVLVRERQEEALRVAVGLTLNDDQVEVFVLDRKVADTPGNAANIEVLKEMQMRVATNCADNADLEFLSNADLARRIAACDIILPY
jgi:hypothetical protein